MGENRFLTLSGSAWKHPGVKAPSFSLGNDQQCYSFHIENICLLWSIEDAQFVGWTYIHLWFLRWARTRERTSSNNPACTSLLHTNLCLRNFTCISEACSFLFYFCAWDYVVILSYSSLCDHRFGLSTFPPASCYGHAMIYWLGYQRAVLLLTLGWVLAVSGLFGKGLKVITNRSGSIPACWPPECSQQEVFFNDEKLEQHGLEGKKEI